MLRFFRRKSVASALSETRKLRIKGVKFVVKKIDAVSYMKGALVLHQGFDTYKVGNDKAQPIPNFDRIKSHYTDVLIEGVVQPVLKRKPEDRGNLMAEDLFLDWEIAETLYENIVELTFGKKKLQQLISQRENSKS